MYHQIIKGITEITEIKMREKIGKIENQHKKKAVTIKLEVKPMSKQRGNIPTYGNDIEECDKNVIMMTSAMKLIRRYKDKSK